MSVIKQLAAMFASMDWNPQKYKLIRFFKDDEVINGYPCYRIYDYASGANYIESGKGITAEYDMIFEIEIDVKNGKTYNISFDFLKGNYDRVDVIRFAAKGPDGKTSTKALAGNPTHFNNVIKNLTYVYTATTDGVLRLQIQYLATAKYCYLIKDSIKVVEN